MDVDPASKTYSQIVGQVEVPTAGDEFHHFGWNACSSASLPTLPMPTGAPVPDRARPRSSSIYVFDMKPDPRRPEIVKAIEPEMIAERTRYSRVTHRPLRPRRHLRQRARLPTGDGPGASFSSTPNLRRARALGVGSRPPISVLRLLVASRLRHDGHQRVGHAQHDRERGDPGDSC